MCSFKKANINWHWVRGFTPGLHSGHLEAHFETEGLNILFFFWNVSWHPFSRMSDTGDLHVTSLVSELSRFPLCWSVVSVIHQCMMELLRLLAQEVLGQASGWCVRHQNCWAHLQPWCSNQERWQQAKILQLLFRQCRIPELNLFLPFRPIPLSRTHSWLLIQ